MESARGDLASCANPLSSENFPELPFVNRDREVLTVLKACCGNVRFVQSKMNKKEPLDPTQYKLCVSSGPGGTGKKSVAKNLLNVAAKPSVRASLMRSGGFDEEMYQQFLKSIYISVDFSELRTSFSSFSSAFLFLVFTSISASLEASTGEVLEESSLFDVDHYGVEWAEEKLISHFGVFDLCSTVKHFRSKYSVDSFLFHFDRVDCLIDRLSSTALNLYDLAGPDVQNWKLSRVWRLWCLLSDFTELSFAHCYVTLQSFAFHQIVNLMDPSMMPPTGLEWIPLRVFSPSDVQWLLRSTPGLSFMKLVQSPDSTKNGAYLVTPRFFSFLCHTLHRCTGGIPRLLEYSVRILHFRRYPLQSMEDIVHTVTELLYVDLQNVDEIYLPSSMCRWNRYDNSLVFAFLVGLSASRQIVRLDSVVDIDRIPANAGDRPDRSEASEVVKRMLRRDSMFGANRLSEDSGKVSRTIMDLIDGWGCYFVCVESDVPVPADMSVVDLGDSCSDRRNSVFRGGYPYSFSAFFRVNLERGTLKEKANGEIEASSLTWLAPTVPPTERSIIVLTPLFVLRKLLTRASAEQIGIFHPLLHYLVQQMDLSPRRFFGVFTCLRMTSQIVNERKKKTWADIIPTLRQSQFFGKSRDGRGPLCLMTPCLVENKLFQALRIAAFARLTYRMRYSSVLSGDDGSIEAVPTVPRARKAATTSVAATGREGRDSKGERRSQSLGIDDIITRGPLPDKLQELASQKPTVAPFHETAASSPSKAMHFPSWFDDAVASESLCGCKITNPVDLSVVACARGLQKFFPGIPFPLESHQFDHPDSAECCYNLKFLFQHYEDLLRPNTFMTLPLHQSPSLIVNPARVKGRNIDTLIMLFAGSRVMRRLQSPAADGKPEKWLKIVERHVSAELRPAVAKACDEVRGESLLSREGVGRYIESEVSVLPECAAAVKGERSCEFVCMFASLEMARGVDAFQCGRIHEFLKSAVEKANSSRKPFEKESVGCSCSLSLTAGVYHIHPMQNFIVKYDVELKDFTEILWMCRRFRLVRSTVFVAERGPLSGSSPIITFNAVEYVLLDRRVGSSVSQSPSAMDLNGWDAVASQEVVASLKFPSAKAFTTEPVQDPGDLCIELERFLVVPGGVEVCILSMDDLRQLLERPTLAYLERIELAYSFEDDFDKARGGAGSQALLVPALMDYVRTDHPPADVPRQPVYRVERFRPQVPDVDVAPLPPLQQTVRRGGVSSLSDAIADTAIPDGPSSLPSGRSNGSLDLVGTRDDWRGRGTAVHGMRTGMDRDRMDLMYTEVRLGVSGPRERSSSGDLEMNHVIESRDDIFHKLHPSLPPSLAPILSPMGHQHRPHSPEPGGYATRARGVSRVPVRPYGTTVELRRTNGRDVTALGEVKNGKAFSVERLSGRMSGGGPRMESPSSAEKLKKNKTHKRKRKDPSAPRPALSAYLLYCQDVRDRVRAEVPEASFLDQGRIFGMRWKELPDSERKRYNALADADRQRFTREMTEYMQAHPADK